MLVSMNQSASAEDVLQVVSTLEHKGIKTKVVREPGRVLVVANRNTEKGSGLETMPSVHAVIETDTPYKLASRKARPAGTVVNVCGVAVGGTNAVMIAGPCSVESREQLLATAIAVKAAGAQMLRGGAYKPRTSPYEFQGLGLDALKLLAEARTETGLPIVTEVMSTDDVELVSEYADVLQIGARNMQNFALLRRVAQSERPVLLKRNPAATVSEWLLAAEYILVGGNPNVMLCERGVKGFSNETRNMLDIGAIALAKQLTHLPVLADPSHATGRRDLVPGVSKAALAAGADGLIVEVHPNPAVALSDGPQSMTFTGFEEMMGELEQPARMLGN